MSDLLVLKVSGHELDDPAFLEELCSQIAALSRPAILIHGGGKEITAALEYYGQKTTFINGVRVTPPESMAVMEMVVCGSISKRIVALLVSKGVQAVGLSGVDLGLLRCVPYRPDGVDLGRVGEITQVDTAAFERMLGLGWLPVVAPVTLGIEDMLPYNTNADHIAQAVASALGASELAFVSNVPGVLVDGAVVPHLTPSQIDELIASGVINGGMIPKVKAAVAALDSGVQATRITNLQGVQNGGTRIQREI
jgi:acetylglutamate kinase